MFNGGHLVMHFPVEPSPPQSPLCNVPACVTNHKRNIIKMLVSTIYYCAVFYTCTCLSHDWVLNCCHDELRFADWFKCAKIGWFYIPMTCHKTMVSLLLWPLQWRHNGRDSVSNHQPHDCLLNRLFRRRSKKTSKLCVTGLCAGNSPGTGEFSAQMASYEENVSISWCHHAMRIPQTRKRRRCWKRRGVFKKPTSTKLLVAFYFMLVRV